MGGEKRERINAVITRDRVRHSKRARAENNENKLMARLILAIVCALSGGERARARKMSVIFMNESKCAQ